jgi:putative ABC transport system permease protein
MARYPLIEERRLLPGDTNAIGINHGLAETRPDIAVSRTLTDGLDGRDATFEVVGMLMEIAVLVAAVGGIGMASPLSLNVIERRREIGVMRAVGAGPGLGPGTVL